MSSYPEGPNPEIERADQPLERLSAEAAQDAARVVANLSVEPKSVTLDEANFADAAAICVEPPQPAPKEPKAVEVAPVAVRQAVQLSGTESERPSERQAPPSVTMDRPKVAPSEKPSSKEDHLDTREERRQH
jgi:hypothetical protein